MYPADPKFVKLEPVVHDVEGTEYPADWSPRKLNVARGSGYVPGDCYDISTYGYDLTLQADSPAWGAGDPKWSDVVGNANNHIGVFDKVGAQNGEKEPEKVNTESLLKAIEDAEKTDTSLYTPESVSQFQKALQDAKDAARDAKDQTAVDRAEKALKDVVGKLKPKPEEPNPEEPNPDNPDPDNPDPDNPNPDNPNPDNPDPDNPNPDNPGPDDTGNSEPEAPAQPADNHSETSQKVTSPKTGDTSPDLPAESAESGNVYQILLLGLAFAAGAVIFAAVGRQERKKDSAPFDER